MELFAKLLKIRIIEGLNRSKSPLRRLIFYMTKTFISKFSLVDSDGSEVKEDKVLGNEKRALTGLKPN